MDRRWKILIVVVVLVAGAIYTMSMVRGERRLVHLDEAAWIFDGYYFEMYASGDWDTDAWREFEPYALHPPAAKYLFGIMLRFIGEPVRSVEPRRIWNEGDLDAFRTPEKFLRQVHSNLSHRQLVSARYMAAAFAALAALMLFILAARLFGAWPALAAFVILVMHPAYRAVAEIGTADSFILFMSVSVMLLALSLGRSLGSGGASRYAWAALFAVALGISFASKLVAFAWVVPAAAFCVHGAGGRKGLARSIVAVALCAAAGVLIAYVLDPGLHGAPLQYMKERVLWRLERAEIQRIFFVNVMLRGLADRLCYFFGHTFFSSRLDMVLAAPLFALGALAPFAFRDLRRRGGLALGCGAFFAALSIYALHVSWMRYVTMALPFIMLIAACGARSLAYAARLWGSWGVAARRALLGYILVCAFFICAVSQYLGPKFCAVPKPPEPDDLFISRIFAYSLKEPCKRPKIHKILYEHFMRAGDEKRAARQLECLDGPPK